MAHPARRHRVPQGGDAHEGTFELLDFEFEPGDMDAITALDRGEDGRTGPNPDTFACVAD